MRDAAFERQNWQPTSICRMVVALMWSQACDNRPSKAQYGRQQPYRVFSSAVSPAGEKRPASQRQFAAGASRVTSPHPSALGAATVALGTMQPPQGTVEYLAGDGSYASPIEKFIVQLVSGVKSQLKN